MCSRTTIQPWIGCQVCCEWPLVLTVQCSFLNKIYFVIEFFADGVALSPDRFVFQLGVLIELGNSRALSIIVNGRREAAIFATGRHCVLVQRFLTHAHVGTICCILPGLDRGYGSVIGVYSGALIVFVELEVNIARAAGCRPWFPNQNSYCQTNNNYNTNDCTRTTTTFLCLFIFNFFQFFLVVLKKIFFNTCHHLSFFYSCFNFVLESIFE